MNYLSYPKRAFPTPAGTSSLGPLIPTLYPLSCAPRTPGCPALASQTCHVLFRAIQSQAGVESASQEAGWGGKCVHVTFRLSSPYQCVPSLMGGVGLYKGVIRRGLPAAPGLAWEAPVAAFPSPSHR